jgi:hypothetical protein
VLVAVEPEPSAGGAVIDGDPEEVELDGRLEAARARGDWASLFTASSWGTTTFISSASSQSPPQREHTSTVTLGPSGGVAGISPMATAQAGQLMGMGGGMARILRRRREPHQMGRR